MIINVIPEQNVLISLLYKLIFVILITLSVASLLKQYSLVAFVKKVSLLLRIQ